MRQLKFRVWDKENNKFYQPTYRAYQGKLEDLAITMSGDLMMRTIDQPAIHESLFPERFEINQFTGLYDDKGIEIYEGDIVEFIDGKRKHISVVNIHPIGVYVEAHPVIKEITGKAIEMLYDYSDYGNGRGITQRCYVLGNIYENPELLKQEKN